jgi:hypothetical protein
MPSPLSEAFVSLLRSDETAALAALTVIAETHRDIFDWAARTFAVPEPRRRAVRRPKANGAHKPGSADPYLSRRQAQRDRDDEALLAAMKDAPGATIGDWVTTIGKSRTSCVSALHRLRDAGLAESVEGKWRLVEEPAARAARWVEPVSAVGRREHASA